MVAIQPEFFAGDCVTYSGLLPEFILKFNNLSAEDRLKVKKLNVGLKGDTLQEPAICCTIMNFVATGICVFPIFLMCCKCTRKVLTEVCDLPIEAYVAIDGAILQCPNLETVSIMIQDSFFDGNKASILERNLSRLPRLINFGFMNTAFDDDIENQ